MVLGKIAFYNTMLLLKALFSFIDYQIVSIKSQIEDCWSRVANIEHDNAFVWAFVGTSDIAAWLPPIEDIVLV